jgi:glycosyltransferase involved in cell wall biosynthesis
MKVLMLNTYDEGGGAARAASRLQTGIQRLGIDSRMLVQLRYGNSKDIVCKDSSLVRLARRVKLNVGLLPAALYPNKPLANFSHALLPDNLLPEVATENPDILHLHWLALGFFQVETLGRFRVPLVWTLHDSWAFTGGCHVPFECRKYQHKCGACPVLGSNGERDLSRWTWKRKEKAWKDLDLTIVTPSRWLAGCARSSSLFQHSRIEVIPNGLDLTVFKPTDKIDARKALGLSQGKKLILFGAISSTTDRNKGFHLLIPALEKLVAEGWRETAELIVFGAPASDTGLVTGMKIHYLGKLQDDKRLSLVYSAADIFVAPSLQENLPNTVMESMACGTPCLAFKQGGMSELIDHGRTGYLAEPYEWRELAYGIGWLLKNDAVRQEMGRGSRRKVETDFGLELIASRYLELYREILAGAMKNV